VARVLVAALALLLVGCDGTDLTPPAGDAGQSTPVVAKDPCGGKCNTIELCVPDAEGVYGCSQICANQLRCWSGCCLPVEGIGYNVCRPSSYCFGP
jgi:hypothetical protein